MQPVHGTATTGSTSVLEEGIGMADVAYVALTIGIFLLCALILRGLEKLR